MSALSQAALDRAVSLPCWTAPSGAEHLSGGITNFNIKLTDQGADYVVRIGDDIPLHGVMRFNELAISRAAHAAGLAPGVHYHEPGALVLDFVEARPLSEAEVSDPTRLPKIIDMVKRCHVEVPKHLRGPVLTFWVFHVLRDYRGTLRDGSSPHLSALPDLMAKADVLEAATGAVDLVLGHNDLLAANILESADRLWLIDWEYGGFNAPLFDLGGLATNNGLSEAQELAMLEQYYEVPPDAALIRRYSAMKCASLLRETPDHSTAIHG